MKNRLWRTSLILTVIATTGLIVTNTAIGKTLVLYSASTGALPAPPWEFINNGPPEETSQHQVFVQAGVLHMIDNALLFGNSLGYLQLIPLNPNQVIDVEFRCRVLAGRSAIDERAPFEVWLYNGTYRADLAVGPESITALGRVPGTTVTPRVILNIPYDGTEWHTYHYKLSPTQLLWFADDIPLAHAGVDRLIVNQTHVDRRINMLITSATGNVELDYIKVDAATNINIDIEPLGAIPSIINPNSTSVIQVAILTTDTFNAATVDPSTISFGATGTEALPLSSALQDVDNDGDTDLIINFQTSQTGIRCGDFIATLKAKTFSGEDLEGDASIQTVHCR